MTSPIFVTREALLRISSEESPAALLGLCAELTERGNRRFVHLVSYREGAPFEDIAVRLRVPEGETVKGVSLASPGREEDLKISFVQEGGFVKFVVPRVVVYEVAVVSM